MTKAETFHINTVDQVVLKRMLTKHKKQIQLLVPEADIHHIGSTAIDHAMTKGDIDFQVRVKQEQFQSAKQALLTLYQINTGSSQTSFFSAFECIDELPIGIQLTVIDSEIDHFWKLTEYLKVNPDIQAKYNDLKLCYEGRLMDEYRERKSIFIEEILESKSFKDFANRL
ncbi:GrpB family protein [Alkalicoccobacillus murimartini]|uniref:GrpB-like predicted nucleotidyltransferase (UPF0157 family) n=1 Tax=Alkalicoccobacillus murimartini TaxID=171685 RepID=A0ABT9YCA8_9BACI|nr:GrpB family protein [Alkalicoccobacillus murimartini]MDQ0205361.1 GrpB-like predicted nucleotidyltransferase (UPF0157 family) [Alkalicoccobacillus murimartini]